MLADPAKIVEEFRNAWIPYFCRSGQRDTSLEEFDREVDGWLPLLPEDLLPRLTGQMLADVVQRKGLLDAFIAMIPKTDGDATPLGQRPLSVLPIVHRVRASCSYGAA